MDDIKGRSAITILENYNGKNPYLKKLKLKLSKSGKLKLTANQTKYIVNNHDKEPIHVNKVIPITTYLGEELNKNYNLSFIPEKILFEYVLAESALIQCK